MVTKVELLNSKLNNSLIELKEYYENGNYIKCYELAKYYNSEYPTNQEIIKYMLETEKDYSLYISSLVIEYAHKGINVEEYHDTIKKFKEKYNNDIISRAYETIINQYKGKRLNKILITVGLSVNILVIIFFLILSLYE